MVVNWDEQERVRQLLTEAVTVLCKNGLKYSTKFCVEGLLGITLDDNDILLVNIKETIATGGSSGISMSLAHTKSPPMVSRSPMGMGNRMAVSSPRRGRAKPVMSPRGRGAFGLNRKRNIFSSPAKQSASPMRTIVTPSKNQMVMPLPDQSGLSEGPPNKLKREEQEGEELAEDVIEIGDEDDNSTAVHTDQSEHDEAAVKQEVADQPSSSTDPQQQQESKFTLDNETNKSLTDFLDNLMTQHDVGPNSSSNQAAAARGGASMSQMPEITPKTEPPMSMSWDQSQQSVGYSPPPGQHSSAPQFHSPSQQSQIMGYRSPQQMMSPRMKQGNYRSPSPAQMRTPPRGPVQMRTSPHGPAPRGSADSDVMMYSAEMVGSGKSLGSESAVGGSKTYKCPKCDKEFQQKGHFFGHMNTHLNVKPYSCDKCGKGFTYSQSLSRHQKSCFTPSKHACTFCGATLANAQELQMHLIQNHSGN